MEIGRVEKSGLVVSERRESEERETSALGFVKRENERAVGGFTNLIRGERG